jgi:hypothetical protein
MDVLTFETCWAVNSEIKQVTSSWSIFIQLSKAYWLLHDLTVTNSTSRPHSVFVRYVRFSEESAITALHITNRLRFIIEMKCVYCAVRKGSLNVI